MTEYTMKKIIKCLCRDSSNHSDIKEAIREELRHYFDDVDDDELEEDGTYYAEVTKFDSFGQDNLSIVLYNSDVALLLNSGELKYRLDW